MVKSEFGRIDMRGELSVLCADVACAIQALRENIARVTGDVDLAERTVRTVCEDGMSASLDTIQHVKE